MTGSQAEMEAKINKERKDAFERFMREPATAMILSMLPPSEHIEAALRVAFESGFNSGSSLTTIEFLKVIMKGPGR